MFVVYVFALMPALRKVMENQWGVYTGDGVIRDWAGVVGAGWMLPNVKLEMWLYLLLIGFLTWSQGKLAQQRNQSENIQLQQHLWYELYFCQWEHKPICVGLRVTLLAGSVTSEIYHSMIVVTVNLMAGEQRSPLSNKMNLCLPVTIPNRAVSDHYLILTLPNPKVKMKCIRTLKWVTDSLHPICSGSILTETS